MPDSENFDDFAIDAVSDNVRVAANNEFARVGNLAATAKQRMIDQDANLVPDGTYNAPRRRRALSGDIVVNLDQVVTRRGVKRMRLRFRC